MDTDRDNDLGPQPPTYTVDATRGPALFYLGTDEVLYRLDNDLDLVPRPEGGRIELVGGPREGAMCQALLDFVRSRFDA